MTVEISHEVLRSELLDRRQKLVQATRPDSASQLAGLLEQVDLALQEMETGSYGVCTVCEGAIDRHRLLHDPLAKVCLECYSPAQRRELERDLESAAEMQAALLPKNGFEFQGWQVHYHLEPLNMVSGDFCDLIEVPGKEGFYLFFGDVAGKGVSASFLTAHLHALFRSLVTEDLSLEHLLVRANRLFCESTLPHSYATLVAARLQRDGSAQVVNAGHWPPILVQGQETIQLTATGQPLGIFCQGSFQTQTVELQTGDSLLLYTDGYSEALNGQGEEYGSERASAILEKTRDQPAQSVLQACLQDLAGFQNGSPRRDDLTVMVVKRS